MSSDKAAAGASNPETQASAKSFSEIDDADEAAPENEQEQEQPEAESNEPNNTTGLCTLARCFLLLVVWLCTFHACTNRPLTRLK